MLILNSALNLINFRNKNKLIFIKYLIYKLIKKYLSLTWETFAPTATTQKYQPSKKSKTAKTNPNN